MFIFAALAQEQITCAIAKLNIVAEFST